MAGPLSTLTVIELGGIGPTPHAGMILADLGAEVIQLSRPGLVPDSGTRADLLSRGKKSMAIDLKTADGPGLVLRLVESADVLIEGFRPGVAERLGVGPDECLSVSPRLVYGRMTGWGQRGPLAGAAGHDIDYIAVSGALASIGPAAQPLPPLNLVGDFGGGSMLLVVGVLAALHHVSITGQGQVVDAAMVDGSALLTTMQHAAMAAGWWTPERGENMFDGAAPFYTTYETADGRWMAVGAIEPHFYEQLLDGLDLTAEALPAQMDRSAWPGLRARLREVFRQRTQSEWEEIFEGTDACVTGVYSMVEAPLHPHNTSRATFVEVDGITQPAPAPRFQGTPASLPESVPTPGQHTREVLSRLGLEPQEISKLEGNGTVSL